MEMTERESSAGSAQKYLYKRGNVYYFKRKLPIDVATRLKKKPGIDVWNSLRTSDEQEAIRRLFKANEQFARICREEATATSLIVSPDAGSTSDNRKYLSLGLVAQVVNRYAHFALEEVDELRRGADVASIRDYLEYCESCLEDRRCENARGDFSAVADAAMAVLRGEKVIPIPNSDAWSRLLEALMLKDIEVLEESVRRLKGMSAFSPAEPPYPVRETPTITDAFQSWRAAFRAGKGLPTNQDNKVEFKTEATYFNYVQVFRDVCGDVVLSQIDENHVGKLVRYLAEEEELARATVKNYVGGLATILRSRTKVDKLDAADGPRCVTRLNVFDLADLRAVPQTPDSELRRAFSDSELVHLFSAHAKKYGEAWSARHLAAAAEFWLCPVLTYTGCRLEEYAQLTVDNVVQKQGCWGIELASLRLGQIAKTKNSSRFIPLHRTLKEMGFLVFVDEARRAGGRLFPNLSNNNKYRRYGPNIGKWFARLCEEIGLTDRRLSTYSLRRNFAQRLLRVGVNQMAIDALMGHWLTKVERKSTSFYFRGDDGQLPLDVLRDAIEKLKYAELDFERNCGARHLSH